MRIGGILLMSVIFLTNAPIQAAPSIVTKAIADTPTPQSLKNFGYRFCDSCDRPKKIFCSPCPTLHRGFNIVANAFRDAIRLNLNLISTESFIVIASTLPVYLGARLADDHIQCHFFSHRNHKNINQMPKWCHELVRFGVGVPIVIFGSQLFLSNDPEWQEAAWMLFLGIPFVIFGKDIIKKFDADF
jgi:hypothetical protein